MAKDDYYVIVYKILAYLYVQLKTGEPVDVKMISCDGPLFSINEKYWTYIIEQLVEYRYIEHIVLARTMGNVVVIQGLENCRITPVGIDYLCNNSLMERAKQFLKDIKAITPFI